MDRGASPADVNLENSIFGRDRRRARRHRVHTPAYANLSGSAQGAVLELSEILNISESGMCIQASSQMKVNRLLPLCLDLSDTGARIHVVGHVVWSEASGRTGIRFPDMAESSRAELQKWLQANAQSEAAANTAMTIPARAELDSASRTLQSKPASSPGYTSLLSEWAEVEKEVDLCGPDLGPALHLLAQRALTLTWASGSAIALVNKLRPSEMICRARAGTDSPEIGARLQVGSGFSGECIRAGKPIICDDSEYDSRVDRASCRALGIRSIVACPVKRNAEVVGIVEIFSPEPAAFWENDVSILQRLCGLVLRAVQRAEHVRADVLEFPGPGESIDAPEAEQGLEFSPLLARELSRRQRIILAAAGSVFIAILGWVIAPWAANLDSATSSFAAPSSAEANTSDDTYITANFKDLQKLAGQGNVRAEYALGMRYASGEGVKQDYHQAMHYFLRSAEAGDLRGQAKAATWFWAGRGVNQDYSKAYFWGLLAQAGGDNTGRAIVLQCAPYLSPAQITAEQKQAEQWLHSHHIGHDDSTQ